MSAFIRKERSEWRMKRMNETYEKGEKKESTIFLLQIYSSLFSSYFESLVNKVHVKKRPYNFMNASLRIEFNTTYVS